MKFDWNFQRGGEVLEKILSVGEVLIFSGTTQCRATYTCGNFYFITRRRLLNFALISVVLAVELSLLLCMQITEND